MRPVDDVELRQLVAGRGKRRVTQGEELVKQFMDGGDSAATLSCHDRQQRDGLARSANVFVKRVGRPVQIKRLGELELLLLRTDTDE